MTPRLKSESEQIVDQYRGYTVTRDGDAMLGYNQAGFFRVFSVASADPGCDIYAKIDMEIARVRSLRRVTEQPALFPGIYLDAIQRRQA